MVRRAAVLAGIVAMTALAGAPVAQSVVIDNESIPLTGFTAFIPCADNGAGELVLLDGDLHVLISFTINGNNISGKDHFQPQSLSGFGTVTGDKYQGTGVTQDEFKGSLQNGQFQQSFVNNFRMIGQGPGNNFTVHENFHITINANGDVTAVHDNFTTDCS
jgi:hypothetical protein